MGKKLTWSLTAFLILVAGFALVFPFVARSRRPGQVVERVTQVRIIKAKVSNALDLGAMTKEFVTSEGPCPGGCHGGILNEYPAVDLWGVVPKFAAFDGKRQVIFWSYHLTPTEIRRKNDAMGDDTLVVKGVPNTKEEISFAVISKSQAQDIVSLSLEVAGP